MGVVKPEDSINRNCTEMINTVIPALFKNYSEMIAVKPDTPIQNHNNTVVKPKDSLINNKNQTDNIMNLKNNPIEYLENEKNNYEDTIVGNSSEQIKDGRTDCNNDKNDHEINNFMKNFFNETLVTFSNSEDSKEEKSSSLAYSELLNVNKNHEMNFRGNIKNGFENDIRILNEIKKNNMNIYNNINLICPNSLINNLNSINYPNSHLTSGLFTSKSFPNTSQPFLTMNLPQSSQNWNNFFYPTSYMLQPFPYNISFNNEFTQMHPLNISLMSDFKKNKSGYNQQLYNNATFKNPYITTSILESIRQNNKRKNENDYNNYSSSDNEGNSSSSSSTINSENLNIRKRKQEEDNNENLNIRKRKKEDNNNNNNNNNINIKSDNCQDDNKKRKLKGKEKDLEEESEENNKKINVHCPICLEEPNVDTPYYTTCCGHIFCESCLNHCLKSKKICPLCRFSFKNKKNYKMRIFFC